MFEVGHLDKKKVAAAKLGRAVAVRFESGGLWSGNESGGGKERGKGPCAEHLC